MSKAFAVTFFGATCLICFGARADFSSLVGAEITIKSDVKVNYTIPLEASSTMSVSFGTEVYANADGREPSITCQLDQDGVVKVINAGTYTVKGVDGTPNTIIHIYMDKGLMIFCSSKDTQGQMLITKKVIESSIPIEISNDF